MQQQHEHHHGADHGRKNSHQKKSFTVIINGRKKTVTDKTLTFDELVHLAFEDPPSGEFICFTITYRRCHSNKPEGILNEGERLKVKNGMIVNVTVTDKS